MTCPVEAIKVSLAFRFERQRSVTNCMCGKWLSTMSKAVVQVSVRNVQRNRCAIMSNGSDDCEMVLCGKLAIQFDLNTGRTLL